MPKRSQPKRGSQGRGSQDLDEDRVKHDLRIIGGTMRGRKLRYEPLQKLKGKQRSEQTTDESPRRGRSRGPRDDADAPKASKRSVAEGRVTRPMKHRVRESIFNLVGPAIKGKHALDLFAGTGALGLEALSRGASAATFIERHVAMAGIVKDNIRTLEVEEQSTVNVTSAFLWSQRDMATDMPQDCPWVVFISPPYDFFIDRAEEMLALMQALAKHAPSDSMLVVEADDRFDFEQLPGNVKADRYDTGWDVRRYHPAIVGIWHQP